MTSPEAHPSATVTGASGFLGGAVVATLKSAGWRVFPVARSSGGGWIQVPDYSESPSADILIHLAEDGDRSRVNAIGEPAVKAARDTLAALFSKGYGHVVYASSAAIYGDAVTEPRTTVETPIPADPYAMMKFANERQTLDHGGTVLRFSNLYGPGMSPANVLTKILAQIPGEGDLTLWDDTAVRDFLWIGDAAAAVRAAAKRRVPGIFNIGSGSGHSVREVAETALAIANQSHRRVRATNASGRISHLVLDISPTVSILGWQPQTSLSGGLAQLIAPPPRPS